MKIGHLVDGKPQLDIDLKGSGKFIMVPFGSKDIYGPFDSIEQLQEWAKAVKT